MDSRIKRGLLKLLPIIAICLLFSVPVLASDISDNQLPPDKRVYDDADLFTDAEERELGDALAACSSELETHFIILTTDEFTELEDYIFGFYETNIRGQGGVNECVALSVNMNTRRVAIDCYGELRTMISDYELTQIREIFTPDLTNGDYAKAAYSFISEMSALVERRYAEYNVDVPEADPSVRLFDYAGVLSGEQFDTLTAQINDLSEKNVLDYIIIILDETADGEYMKRYSRSFYHKNLKGKSAYDGVYMLTISSSAVSLFPFGSYAPVNRVLWDDSYYIGSKLRYYSIYPACAYFLGTKTDKWQSEHMELSVNFEPQDHIFDYAGVMSETEIERLSAFAGEESRKHETHFYMITIPYSGYDAVTAFIEKFYNMYYEQFPENCLILFSGILPNIEGEYPKVRFMYYGDKANAKIGYKAYNSVVNSVESAADAGDYAAACEAYINTASAALSSLIPNIAMTEEALTALTYSFLIALTVSALIIIVLRIMHGFGLKSKPSASGYMDEDSFVLYYSTDRFVSTHTTQTKIERNTNTGGGGGGGGSSGGGSSSRSEGSF